MTLHYRQAEFNRLWVVDKKQVEEFGAAFVSTVHVDGALFPFAGHCIEFHKLGAAFRIEQLAFRVTMCHCALNWDFVRGQLSGDCIRGVRPHNPSHEDSPLGTNRVYSIAYLESQDGW